MTSIFYSLTHFCQDFCGSVARGCGDATIYLAVHPIASLFVTLSFVIFATYAMRTSSSH